MGVDNANAPALREQPGAWHQEVGS
jgi:hypothetical protein